MTTGDKSKNRLKQSWYSFWLMVAMIIGIFYLFAVGNDVKPLADFVNWVIGVLIGKEGVNLYTTPKSGKDV
ncbi:MAG: hypothetical protein U9Q38_02475 [Thermodesulfobacteriota bacterium]|nr:hypothetical protein [Thermodesulfobacteriota bacterium]